MHCCLAALDPYCPVRPPQGRARRELLDSREMEDAFNRHVAALLSQARRLAVGTACRAG